MASGVLNGGGIPQLDGRSRTVSEAARCTVCPSGTSSAVSAVAATIATAAATSSMSAVRPDRGISDTRPTLRQAAVRSCPSDAYDECTRRAGRARGARRRYQVSPSAGSRAKKLPRGCIDLRIEMPCTGAARARHFCAHVLCIMLIYPGCWLAALADGRHQQAQ